MSVLRKQDDVIKRWILAPLIGLSCLSCQEGKVLPTREGRQADTQQPPADITHWNAAWGLGSVRWPSLDTTPDGYSKVRPPESQPIKASGGQGSDKMYKEDYKCHWKS